MLAIGTLDTNYHVSLKRNEIVFVPQKKSKFISWAVDSVALFTAVGNNFGQMGQWFQRFNAADFLCVYFKFEKQTFALFN